MATLAEVIELMASMSIAYPNYVAKEGASRAYHMVLEDVDYDALSAGAKVCLASDSAFFPSAGQWRKASLDIVVNRLRLPTAAEAWENVQSEMRRCGGYYDYLGNPEVKIPVYAHPIIQRTVEIMNYRELYISTDPVTVVRAQFTKIYDQLLERALADFAQLPDVRATAEKYFDRKLEISNSIKQLSERMAHP